MRAPHALRSLAAGAGAPVLVWLALCGPGCVPSGVREAVLGDTGGSGAGATGGSGRSTGGSGGAGGGTGGQASGAGGLAPASGGGGGGAADASVATGGTSGAGGVPGGGGSGGRGDPADSGIDQLGAGGAPSVDMGRPGVPADAGAPDVSAPSPDAATACVTALPGAYMNTAMSGQTGTFTVQFEATPSASPTNSIIALSNGPQMAYAGFAVAVRFNPTGTIDALSGMVYEAASAIPYSAGSKYRFRIAVDVPAHSYSSYVTAPGGTEKTVGTNLDFRTGHETLTSLSSWAVVAQTAAAGSTSVCGFAVR